MMKIRYFIILCSFLLTIGQTFAKSPAPMQVDGAVTISTKQAKSLMNQGVTFIDVRGITDYQTRHIQWAIHLDLKLDLTEASLLNTVQKQQPLVFYCNGDHCQRSAIASQKAIKWGWTHVFYYRGGFPAWVKASLPVAE